MAHHEPSADEDNASTTTDPKPSRHSATHATDLKPEHTADSETEPTTKMELERLPEATFALEPKHISESDQVLEPGTVTGGVRWDELEPSSHSSH